MTPEQIKQQADTLKSDFKAGMKVLLLIIIIKILIITTGCAPAHYSHQYQDKLITELKTDR